ncbi:paralemmin 1a isoform X5 [Etheostoma cragini]|uniref:paralemmin 1a isoform X5 n=1 Tax=Etheostoma cragini TaxID=417921 RepID=UPI00155DE958|nr:paralemmin 1a isoform X5 [Etheostoma cragini]
MKQTKKSHDKPDSMVSESQQDRVHLLSEKRKWLTEIENKKRQLEDDKRALQHLKSKALRERWLLDGAPSAGPEQDAVRTQLKQDETRTRSLEDNINRLEEELLSLETGSVCQTTTNTVVCPGSVEESFAEVRAPKSPRVNGASEEMKRVVHEMNGEDGVQLLSVSEVEDLIHKADEASVTSQTVATVTSLPTAEAAAVSSPDAPPPAEIRGLRAEPGAEPGPVDATAAAPLTMVFMGYQSVEDEDETKKVFGLVGTVTAERVLIHDDTASEETSTSAAQEAPPPHGNNKPTETVAAPVGNGKEEREGKEGKEEREGKEGKEEREGKEGKEGKEERGGKEGKEGKEVEEEMKKEKKPCKCCSIM